MTRSHAQLLRLLLLALLVVALALALGGFSWDPDAVVAAL